MHASRGIRKTHRKTKTGCKTCRQRRVKCDETKPECFNCQRRGVDCLWDENTAVTLSGSSSGSVQSASRSIPCSQVAHTCRLAMADMLGVELMHYYMAHTSLSLMTETTDDYTLQYLQLVAPRTALRCPPLMAMIFALTTLHIHIAEHGFPETVPERNYLELSENFAASALRDNPADYDVNMYDTKDPVCIINSLFSLVSLSHPNFQLASFSPGPMIDPAYIYPDHPFSWLAASRYSQTKAMEHWNPYFKKERPIVIPAGPVSLEIHVNNICYDNLLPFPELLTFIHTSGAPDPMELAADGQVSRVYEEAVRHLKLLWNVSYQKYSEQFKLMLWPYAMSQTFYELVMAKQPRALVIFAHYCALLGQFQDKWILRNRGKSDTKAIMDILGADSVWVPWMQVPLTQMKANTGSDRAIPLQERLLMAF